MNPKNPTHDPIRRKFIGQCCAAVTATGMLSTLAQLRMMGAVASPGNGPATPPRAGAVNTDFKALVCLFLAGGNDANNMVVPFDTTGYNDYSSAAGRGAIVEVRQLVNDDVVDDAGRQQDRLPVEVHALVLAAGAPAIAEIADLNALRRDIHPG